MIADCGLDNFFTRGYPRRDRAVRILLQQPRVACYVSSENRRHPALLGLIPDGLPRSNSGGAF